MSDENDDDAEDAERAALNARLQKLNAALRKVDEEQAAAEAAPRTERKGFTRAMRVGLNAFSEFVGAVLVSAFIGWQADQWLGTTPWLLIVMLGLGVAAGFWNVYRVAKPKAPGEE
ncbi:AtpZ/AtpI family protein [Methylocystis sp. L43]|jgi:ATP synthase protein I|uniref:AtpZ/AtpI family protein n=1 Tax=unclassified Methylocystis TaxID=2625913 RepID=UPI0018C27BD5|nr:MULTISPECIES: AtpZ/AtpI family protein [unclassified Methylocystis]MBG0798704.1 AtpZ/AtpI family protein [Methylocystis sp. L43]MBG0806211.1 AtpZ/AtpI family protein [Methylocystis sp. H15]